ncbi:hypothetical protein QJS66_14100 [Kocuria rhizophila]|nr:hypothetical protein QJS66_14100 [Kocuria rhizophila]
MSIRLTRGKPAGGGAAGAGDERQGAAWPDAHYLSRCTRSWTRPRPLPGAPGAGTDLAECRRRPASPPW